MDTLSSSASLTPVIDRLTEKYAKLWPLQTFNASNPLVAYEHLPFSSAMAQASQDLNFSVENSISVFRALYQKQQFSLPEIDWALKQNTSGFLDQTIALPNRDVTYRSVLREELQQDLSLGTSGTPQRHNFLETEQALDSLLLTYLEKHAIPGASIFEELSGPSLAANKWIDEQMSQWLAAYLDEGQAIWSMPNQKKPLRYAWSNLITHDQTIPKAVKTPLSALVLRFIQPELPAEEALSQLLQGQGLGAEQQETLIACHLKQLPGWVGYIQYRQSTDLAQKDVLYDYLLIRLLYHFACESADWPRQTPNSACHTKTFQQLRARLIQLLNSALFIPFSADKRLSIVSGSFESWMAYLNTVESHQKIEILMAALEKAQNSPLETQLSAAFQKISTHLAPIQVEPDAQAVFCIDVRSEPFRRWLEMTGNIETYGFAGFFGLPIEKLGYTSNEAIALCPILLNPQYTIPEQPSPLLEKNPIGKLLRQGLPLREQWIYSLKKIKRDTFATFSYVESFGIIHAITLLRDSFAALTVGKMRQNFINTLSPLLGLNPKLTLNPKNPGEKQTGLSLPQQVELAKGILKLMGIRQPYAEFVILCGHFSRSRNNPYASALDCGACGANGGGFNARVLCQILNHPDVREALAVEGFVIPEHTQFIAAEHNTTTHEINFLSSDTIPSQQQQRFLAVKRSFEIAGERTRLNYGEAQTAQALSLNPNRLLAASYDWSETRPEWGLSKNQAFIIGQREAIKTLDLEGRCFLHSYDWQTDSDGSILSAIMTAPMIVGAWINLQYCFSTLDQNRFGSGKKYVHNVVGLLGTYVGNASDLQLGLPYESLFENDGTPYHYPQRLLVCIQAPRHRVQAIVDAHQAVKQLVGNQWINLSVYDPETQRLYRFHNDGWESSMTESLNVA